MAAEVALLGSTLKIGHVQKLFGGVVTSPYRGMSYGSTMDGQQVLVVDDESTPSALLPRVT